MSSGGGARREKDNVDNFKKPDSENKRENGIGKFDSVPGL